MSEETKCGCRIEYTGLWGIQNFIVKCKPCRTALERAERAEARIAALLASAEMPPEPKWLKEWSDYPHGSLVEDRAREIVWAYIDLRDYAHKKEALVGQLRHTCETQRVDIEIRRKREGESPRGTSGFGSTEGKAPLSDRWSKEFAKAADAESDRADRAEALVAQLRDALRELRSALSKHILEDELKLVDAALAAAEGKEPR